MRHVKRVCMYALTGISLEVRHRRT